MPECNRVFVASVSDMSRGVGARTRVDAASPACAKCSSKPSALSLLPLVGSDDLRVEAREVVVDVVLLRLGRFLRGPHVSRAPVRQCAGAVGDAPERPCMRATTAQAWRILVRCSLGTPNILSHPPWSASSSPSTAVGSPLHASRRTQDTAHDAQTGVRRRGIRFPHAELRQRRQFGRGGDARERLRRILAHDHLGEDGWMGSQTQIGTRADWEVGYGLGERATFEIPAWATPVRPAPAPPEIHPAVF